MMMIHAPIRAKLVARVPLSVSIIIGRVACGVCGLMGAHGRN
jgi:hypothetical protein